MKISKRYRKSILSKKFNELLSRGFIGYLITNKRYVKSVVSKKFIELLIMGSIGYLIIFVGYLSSFTTGTGTLSQIDEIWYIYYNNDKYPIPIANPKDFPHILIPENDGKEVHYVAYFHWFEPAFGFEPIQNYIVFLDTIQVFTIKQNLFFTFVGFVGIISSVFLIYIIRNNKNYLIINTIKKQKVKPVEKKTFNNLINVNHYT